MPPPADLPSLPNLPSPVSLIAPIAGLAGDAADWAGDKIGKAGQGAKDMAGKIADITGLGGVAGKIEESVSKIRDFATEQVDSLLNGAASAAKATEEFARETLDGARTKVGSTVDSALDTAKEIVKEIEGVPASASEILDDAQRIKQRALERRDSLKHHRQRFRERKAKIPKVVGQHLEEIFVELDEELELEAMEAERLGTKVEQDSTRLYNKTVEDAKHYGGQLIKQTEQNYRRGKKLRDDLQKDKKSVQTWAKDQANRVKAFKQDRKLAAKKIRSLSAAESWATESIEGAHQLAKDIKDEVGKKPGELKSLGQKRVDEAMELAQGVKQEVKTAADWARTQKGSNAAWKRAMRETQHSAESFLQAQGARVALRISTHGDAIGTVARNVGEEQLEDTGKEFGKSFDDAKKTYKEIQGAIHGDKKEIEEELGHTAEIHPEGKPSNVHRSLDLSFALDIDDFDKVSEAVEPLQVEEGGKKAVPTPVGKPKPKTAEKAPKAKEIETTKQKPAEKNGPTNAAKTVGPPETVKAAEPAEKASASVSKPPAEQKKPESQATGPVARPGPFPDVTISVPSPPAGPVPVPYPNIETKTAKGKAVPAISPPKKDLPKPAAKQESGKATSAAAESKPAYASAPAKSEKSASPAPSAAKPKAGTAGEVKPTNALANAAALAAKDSKVREQDKPVGIKQAVAGTKPGMAIQKKEAERQQVQDPKMFQEKLVAAGGTGKPPDDATRKHIAPHIGFDPAMVRFHTGPAAQAAAAALSADAFTIGSNIFFAAGKFDPRSPKGLGLIGHEAKHVGQQLGLGGSKMQFATKTGGDAMEQEAQEVGERIASNLSYGMGLRVGKYVRTYEPADDEPITTALQIKLDRLSMQALSRASRFLTSIRREKPVRFDEILVDLSLDMEGLSDSEIVDVWADAIVAAVESARPDSPNAIPEAEMLAPATHVLQKKLGDPGQEATPDPPPKVDPETMARIVKVSPSAKDKDMIRKLLVRKDVDQLVTEAKARGKQARDSWARSVPFGGPVPKQPPIISDDDRTAIEAILKGVEINSFEEFEQLKTDFVQAFAEKGANITTFLLEENLKIVLNEKKKYLSRDKKDPDAPINSIRKASEEVKKAMDGYIAALNLLDPFVWIRLGAHSNSPTYGNLDSLTDLIAEKIHPSWVGSLEAPYKNFMKVRQAHGNKHPLLLSRNFNPDTILNEKDPGKLELQLFWHFEEMEKDIKYAKGEMSPKKFWELQPMVEMTKKQLGVRPGDGAETTLNEFQTEKANDERFWAILQAAAAIGLAITAMVATGGLAAVAMVGSAGLSVYSAAKAADDYMFKSAAVNSSLDQARLISKDEPSLFWLAVELIGAGLDVAGAVGAFAKIAKIAKSAVMTKGEKAALKELEDAARSAYKETKGLSMSEDDFVARLLESAKKGASGTESMVKQAKLATELLEGTSARAVAIMKGDSAAIQSLVTEYGNWKGLMGALTNGGEDAAKMSKNIGAWRQKVIDDLAGRGAKPLENASTEVVSDFDLNVKPLDGKGAGERVIEFEKEMAGKYGANWSESLLLNFYTDKSQLMKVEEALKAVNPQRRAQILARVTEKSEKLNFAKMLEHAGDDPAAIKQVEELMASTGVKYSVDELKELGNAVKNKGRDTLLRDIDAKIKELESMPANSPNRIAKAEEITELQMEANFLTKEAYISPAAVKGGPLTNAEAYQSALSQLEMIRHVIHESGGDILKACREYELFKYINRYAGAAKKAGVNSPGLNYFESLSTYIYKRARSAHMETGHLPGVTPADEALEAAVDGKWLLDQYDMFRKEVAESMPKMREAALKNPAEKWKPEMSAPAPAAGKPATPPSSTPTPTPSAGPQNLYTPPPMDPKKAAGLPAAAVKTAEAAEKMMEKKDAKKALVGPHNAVVSAGFGTTKAYQGIGVFRTHIPGVSKEVLVTVMSIDDKGKFDGQLAAAIAAEKTGIGPKVLGKVEMGEKKLAFATEIVEGGYADAYNNKLDDPYDKNWAKQDMMKNASNITKTTFMDLDTFRNSIFESGFYYVGPVDGFVQPDGHWKPVNFSNAAPFTDSTVFDEARKMHDEQFNTLRDNLMQNHLQALKERSPKP